MCARQCAALLSVVRALHNCGCSAQGAIALELAPGPHAVSVQWQKYGSAVVAWSNLPDFLDGFAVSRSLVVVTSSMPIHTSAVLARAQPGGPASWRDMTDGAVTFQLPSVSYVHVTYSANVNRFGSPTFDSFDWERWGSISSRVELDGMPYAESSSILDGTFAQSDALVGSLVVRLAAGTHTAALQWKPAGESPADWASFVEMMDGFAGARVIIGVVSAYNSAPTIRAPASFASCEDSPLVLAGLGVADVDALVHPTMDVVVALHVEHGLLQLPFPATFNVLPAMCNASACASVRFVGPIEDVNAVLARATYTPLPDYEGSDTLVIDVSDLGSVGIGGALSASREVAMDVAAVNDAPVILCPVSFAGLEDTPLALAGITFFDVDTVGSPAMMQLSLVVLGGTLAFDVPRDVVVRRGSGKLDRSVTALGSLNALNTLAASLVYTSDLNSNSNRMAEVLTVSIDDLGGIGMPDGCPVVSGDFGDHAEPTKFSLVDARSIRVNITPVNDAPIITAPAVQSVTIGGLSVVLGAGGENATVRAQVMNCFAWIQASAQSSVHVVEEAAVRDAGHASRGRSVLLSGAVEEVSRALDSLKYSRDPPFSGGDTLVVSVVGVAGSERFVEISLHSTLSLSDAVLTSCDPSVAMAGHMTFLTVHGNGFGRFPALFCQFGAEFPVLAVRTGDSRVQCSVLVPGKLIVPIVLLLRVTDNLTSWTNALEVTFVPAPRVEYMSPIVVSAAGGTILRIVGLEFFVTLPMSCTFSMESGTTLDGVTANVSQARTVTSSALWHSPRLSQCLVPPATSLLEQLVDGEILVTLSSGLVPLGVQSVRVLSGPHVSAISPSVVDTTRSITIRLAGTGFVVTPQAVCDVDGLRIVPTILGQQVAELVIPPTTNHGQSIVRCSVDGNVFGETGTLLRTLWPHVIAATPRSGDVAGGTWVTISVTPTNSSSVSCRFGYSITEGLRVSATVVSCQSPSRCCVGAVNLDVSLNGVQFTSSGLQFSYLATPELWGALPLSGPAAGGTAVRITGVNFADTQDLLCRFGGDDVTALAMSLTSVLCYSPEHAPGAVLLQVSANGIDFFGDLSFHYVNTLLSTSSRQRGDAGNQFVELSGEAFADDAMMVCVGPAGVSPASLVTPAQVLCESKGVSMSFSQNGDAVATASARGALAGNATIVDVRPLIAFSGAEFHVQFTVVLIAQTDFVACTVNSAPVPSSVMPPTVIRCLLGVSQPGIVRVSLTVNGVERGSRDIVITDHSSVVRVAPTTAISGVSTEITLYGDKFNALVTYGCSFDGMVILATWVRPDILVCTSPALRTGDVSIVVLEGETEVWAGEALKLLVADAPTVTDTHPNVVIQGGALKIQGFGFIGDVAAVCSFAGTLVHAQVLSTTVVSCGVPQTVAGDVPVYFSANGLDFTTDVVIAHVLRPCTLHSVSPRIVVVGIPTVLRIVGDLIPVGILLVVRLGGMTVETAQTSNSSVLVVDFPGFLATGFNSLILETVEGVLVAQYELMLEVIQLIELTTAWPIEVPANGEQHRIVIRASTMTSRDNWGCTMNGITGDAVYISGSELSCLTPRMPTFPLVVAVSIGGVVASNSISLSEAGAARVVSLLPDHGAARGGVVVTLTGSGFLLSPLAACSFGGVSVPACFVDNSSIVCSTPALPQGPHAVTLTLDGIRSFACGVFIAVEAIGVIAVSPRSVPARFSVPINLTTSRALAADANHACVVSDVVFAAHSLGAMVLSCLISIDNIGVFEVAACENGICGIAHIVLAVTPRASILFVPPARVGQSVVSVFGTNFVNSEHLSCGIGGNIGGGQAAWQSTNHLLCEVELTTSGLQVVAVSNNGRDVDAFAEFLAKAAPSLKSLAPAAGCSGGRVVLSGSGLHGGRVMCNFGFTSVRAVMATDAEVVCVVPYIDVAGPTTVSVTVDNNTAFDAFTFDYFFVPLVMAAEPVSGVREGGTLVVVSGHNFRDTPSITCRFGLQSVEAVFSTPSSVSCLSPAFAGGDHVLLSVIHSDTESALVTGIKFSYTDIITVSPPAPLFGPTSGGTVVSFRCSLWGGTEPVCHFGDQFVDLSQSLFGELATCVSPQYPVAGSVPLSIVGCGATTVTAEFVYYENPQFLSVRPLIVDRSGTTLVKISTTTATTMSSSVMCWFGSTPVGAVVISSSAVACLAPPYSGCNSTSVSIALNGINIAPSQLEVTYAAARGGATIFPRAGPCAGGTMVYIDVMTPPAEGSAYCRFGTVVVGATVNGAIVACEAPPSAPGEVEVAVLQGGLSIASNWPPYLYTSTPYITRVLPQLLWHQGADVTVFGGNFVYTRMTTCRFSIVVVEALWVSPTVITCRFPGSAHDEITVEVSNDGVTYGVVLARVRSYNNVTISRMAPLSALVGSVVAVHGHAFPQSDTSSCRFGGSLMMSATVSDGTSARCVVPNAVGASIAVELTFDGVLFFAVPKPLSVVAPISAIEVTGRAGPVEGGNEVLARAPGISILMTSCVFGSVSAVASIVDVDTISCIVPRSLHGAGFVRFVVGQVDNVDVNVGMRYLYVGAPRITGIDVSRTQCGEPAEVRIVGSGFSTDAESVVCTVGGVRYVAGSVDKGEVHVTIAIVYGNNNTSVSCSNDGGLSFSSKVSARQLRCSNYSAVSVLPQKGFAQGGTVVTATGLALRLDDDVYCRFGNDIVQCAVRDDGRSVSFVSPPCGFECIDGNYEAILSISVNAGEFSILPATFGYAHVAFGGMSPQNGLDVGGTLVSLLGNGFHAVSKLRCLFGSVFVAAVVLSDVALSCIAPPHNTGAVRLALESNGATLEPASQSSFQYTLGIQVLSTSRTAGPESGGTVVVLRAMYEVMPAAAGAIRFGDSVEGIVSILIDETQQLYCQTPPHKPGIVSIFIDNGLVAFVDTGLSFTYFARPVVQTVSPSSGPVAGGTRVVVAGTSFVESLNIVCMFGAGSAPGTFVDVNHVQCITPPALAGAVPVSLSFNALDCSEAGPVFSYQEQPYVLSVSPNSGSSFGETVFTISGLKLGKTVFCVAGTFRTVPIAVSESRVECTTAQGAAVGVVDVGVVDASMHQSILVGGFEILPATLLLSATPQRVSERGGTVVEVVGAFMQKAEMCVFSSGVNDVQVPARTLGVSLLSCVTPALPAGPALLSLRSQGKQMMANLLSIVVVPRMVINSVDPTSCAYNGACDVLVRGTNFAALADLSCSFGVLQVPASFVSVTAVRCIAPASISGSFRITVRAGLSDFAESATNFTFLLPTEIVSFFPSTATLAAVLVKIRLSQIPTGKAARCMFGDALVPVTNGDDAFSVNCIAPQLAAPAAQSIYISFTDGEIALGTAVLVRITAPYVREVLPTVIRDVGAAEIVVRGFDFCDDAVCLFDKHAVRARVTSAEHLVCVSPPMPVGRVVLAIACGAAVFEADSALILTVIPRPGVARITPTFGSVRGNTIITLRGNNFPTAGDAYCAFLGQHVRAALIDESTMKCVTRPGLLGTTSVAVLYQGQYYSSSTSFEFVMDAIVKTVTLSMDSAHTLVLQGEHFVSSDAAVCRIGTAVVSAVVLSETTAQCAIPALGDGGGHVLVGLACNGVDFTDSFAVAINPAPTLFSVYPTRIHDEGGSQVSLRGDAFFAPTPQCMIDNAYPSVAVYVSVTALTCVLPALVPGAHVVSVSNDGISFSNALRFDVAAHFDITAVVPSVGLSNIATQIRITGHGLAAALRHTFMLADQRVACSAVSDTHALCIVPPGPPGTKPLVIVLDGKVVRLLSSFSHVLAPVVLFVVPSMGTIQGGEMISLSGSGFPQPFWCRFGNSIVQSRVESAWKAVCVTPAQGEGRVAVEISVNGHDFVKSGAAYQYTTPPVALHVVPSMATPGTAVFVRIAPGSAASDTPVICRFGQTATMGDVLSPNTIGCTVPFISPGALSLVVMLHSVELGGVLRFEVLVTPVLTSVYAHEGGARKTVTINGTGLDGRGSPVCRVGATQYPAVVYGNNLAQCIVPAVPALNAASPILVSFVASGAGGVTNSLLLETSSGVLAVLRVAPASGVDVGGTVVDIVFSALVVSRSVICAFGSLESPAHKVVGSTVSCVSVGGRAGNSSLLTVHLDGVVYGVTEFGYYEREIVLSIDPPRGSRKGGMLVTIMGANFASSAAIAVRFGASIVPAIRLSHTVLSCFAPQLSPGIFAVGVGNNGVEFSSGTAAFVVDRTISVLSLSPKHGPSAGGTAITVYCDELPPAPVIFCRVGAHTFASIVVNAHDVVCVSPLSNSGVVAVALSSNAVDWSADIGYTYDADVVAIALAPASGSSLGGTAVQVVGAGLLAVVACRFSSQSEEVRASRTLNGVSCLSPAHAAGLVDILLSTDGQQYFSSGLKYAFVDLAVGIRIVPAMALESGGAIVTISGTISAALPTAADDMFCKFDAHVVPAKWLAANVLQCVAPPHQAGTVALEVSTNSLEYTNTGSTFLYYAAVSVAAVVPSFATRLGGTPVIAIGVGFFATPSLSCVFGHFAEPATFVNSTAVSCLTPAAGSLGAVPFSVTVDAQDAPSSVVQFMFVEGIRVAGVAPPTIVAHQSSRILVTVDRAFDSADLSSVACYFFLDSSGALVAVVKAVRATKSLFECVLGGTDVGVYRVEVSENGVDVSNDGFIIEAVQAPVIHTVKPSRSAGSAAIGTVLLVDGNNFVNSPLLACVFDGMDNVRAQWLSPFQLECTAPANTRSRTVNMCVTNNGVDCGTSAIAIVALSALGVTSVKPTLGVAVGGTIVVVNGMDFVDAAALVCLFDDTVVGARYISPYQVTCRSPSHAPGVSCVRVAIALPPLFTGPCVPFMYVDQWRVSRVVPSVAVQGGTVELHGDGFVVGTEGAVCTFNGIIAAAHVLSNDRAVCVVPPINAALAVVTVSMNGVDLSTGPAVFLDVLASAPMIALVEPAEAVSNRDQRLVVSGSWLANAGGVRCLVSDVLSQWVPIEFAAVYLSERLVVCPLPALSADNVYLRVQIGDSAVASLATTVRLLRQVPIFSMEPNAGAMSGGGVVALWVQMDAQHLTRSVSCRFGSTQTTAATVLSAQRVLCHVPASLQVGRVAVLVLVNGLDVTADTTRDWMYSYVPDNIALSTFPTSGPTSGGTHITISLTAQISQTAAYECLFGTALLVRAVMKDSKSLTCVTPTAAAGGMVVSVGYAGDYTPLTQTFMFYEPEQVVDVSPLVVQSNNQAISIRGSFFRPTEAISCLFSGSAGTPGTTSSKTQARWFSASQVTCDVPFGAAGSLNVYVSNNGVDRNDASFAVVTIEPAPLVRGFTLPIASSMGGSTIEVVGEQFRASVRYVCQFGSQISVATFVADSLLQCVAPAHSPGAVEFSVLTNDVYISSVDALGGVLTVLYVAEPRVSLVEPHFGSIAGGTLVTVTVRDSVLHVDRCVFDDVVVRATHVHKNSVSCVTPPRGRASAVQLRLNTTYGVASPDFVAFSYDAAAAAVSVLPQYGPSHGGTTITITGFNFHDDFTLQCVFICPDSVERNTVVARFVLPTQVTCASPICEAGNAHITVVHGNSEPAFWVQYTFVGELTVDAVSPLFVSTTGSVAIVVTGRGFFEADSLSCGLFDDHSTIVIRARYDAPNAVTCVVPPHAPGPVSVRISVTPTVWSQSSGRISYVADVRVLGVTPAIVSIDVSTKITILVDSSISNIAACSVGGLITSAVHVNLTAVSCEAPSLPSPGLVPLELIYRNGHTTVGASVLRYANASRLLSLAPEWGPDCGGTAVNVYGIGFRSTGSAACLFGSVLATGLWKSSSHVICVSPPLAATSVSVILVIDGAPVSNDVLVYEYVHAPEVSVTDPTTGARRGGTRVKVTGSHFLKLGTFCRFGAVSSPAVYVSTEVVWCTSPAAHATGPVGVSVSTNGVDFFDSPAVFMYTDVPFALVARIAAADAALFNTVDVVAGGIDPAAFMSAGARCLVNGTLTTVVSASADHVTCALPGRTVGAVRVDISSNGVDWTGTPALFFVLPPPAVASVIPGYAPLGGTPVVVRGTNFTNSALLRCRFGALEAAATFITSTTIMCSAPLVTLAATVFVQVSNYGGAWSESRVRFRYHNPALVLSVVPKHGPRGGGTRVAISGFGMSRDTATYCSFGHVLVPATPIAGGSSVSCVAPASSAAGTVGVAVTGDNATYSVLGAMSWFTYEAVPSVRDVSPRTGPVSGGAVVRLSGSELFRTDWVPVCRFDGTHAAGRYVTPAVIECIAPLRGVAGVGSLDLSLNGGADFYETGAVFAWVSPVSVSRVTPMTAPALSGVVVSVLGAGFVDTSLSRCRFGVHDAPASYVDGTTMTCRSPALLPSRVPLSVTMDGVMFSASIDFVFVDNAAVFLLNPTRGLVTGQLPVFVRGKGFVNSTALKCAFGDRIVRATFVSPRLLVCISPSRVSAFDQAAESVAVEVANNGADFTSSGVSFQYLGACEPGAYAPGLGMLPCPNGTACSGAGACAINFTLCAPGTFQPRAAQHACLRCPVGYTCPDAGMSRPILCRAGSVCDVPGLVTPVTACPAGHSCAPGTKSLDPSDLLDVHTSSHVTWGQRLLRPEWLMDAETGAATFDATVRFPWTIVTRVLPETWTHEPENPPRSYSRSSGRIIGTPLLAERPLPCPIGYYCRPGVASMVPLLTNFSTPQACFAGYFCPRGSTTPEGNGPCPTGYYCPTVQDAYICPSGSYCPLTGNTIPRLCLPGSYNPLRQRSQCTLCPPGHVCPSWGMREPELCPAGFVCADRGSSWPATQCPQGYFCLNGTLTTDHSIPTAGLRRALQLELVSGPAAPTWAQVGSVPLQPLPCPPGTFCLGGVAHNVALNWLPSVPSGAQAPQVCTEGTYCKLAVPTSGGTAPCFPGHYCPPGGYYPIKSPLGNFAAASGAVAASLCFPGSYQPLIAAPSCLPCPAGRSCVSYGTYEATVCPTGTYRSVVDSISCRLCPTSTFGPDTGAADISECYPCPAGRVCGLDGMINLEQSVACPDGHVCMDATSNTQQFEHPCAAGYFCDVQTLPSNQFNFMCEAGNFCPQGTKLILRGRNKCSVSYFCPTGSTSAFPVETKCPAYTTTEAGGAKLTDCHIKPVNVCDKLANVYYYPGRFFGAQGITTDEEVAATRINVVDEANSDAYWVNDTIGIVRVCPAATRFVYGGVVTVIGLRFLDTGTIMCNFTNVRNDGGVDSAYSKGTFVSGHRITCTPPKFDADGTVQVSLSLYGTVYVPVYGAISVKNVPSFEPTAASIAACLVAQPADTLDVYDNDLNRYFAATGFSYAQLSIDWAHIPAALTYGVDYVFAVYVTPSTCVDVQCDAARNILDDQEVLMTSPCRQPVPMSPWFLDPTVHKNSFFNVTFLVFEDVLFHVEVQILNNLYASIATHFLKTVIVEVVSPARTNVTFGVVDPPQRRLGSGISYEGRMVTANYIFPVVYDPALGGSFSMPLNLPPRFRQFETGRVLAGMNVSSENIVIPTVSLTQAQATVPATYWSNPQGDVRTLLSRYRETNQLTTLVGGSPQVTYPYVVEPYLFYFSNCNGYDRYAPLWHVLEDNSCTVPKAGSPGVNAERANFPPFPHQDDIRYVAPIDLFATPIADVCYRKLQCHYEEDLKSEDITPRWYEAASGSYLFYILRTPQTLDDFLKGAGAEVQNLINAQSSDVLIGVAANNDAWATVVGSCTSGGCIPRSMNLTITYYQVSLTEKRLINVLLEFGSYDRNTAVSSYELNIKWYALNYIELIIAFAFTPLTFGLLYALIGIIIVAMIYVYYYFLSTGLSIKRGAAWVAPKFRLVAFLKIVAPAPVVGVVFAIAPAAATLMFAYCLISGDEYFRSPGDTSPWLLDAIAGQYAVIPQATLIPNLRSGRLGLCIMTIALYCVAIAAKAYASRSAWLRAWDADNVLRRFMPKLASRREREAAKEGKSNESTWTPTAWKRSFISMLWLIVAGLMVCEMEFSYWSGFGSIVWTFLIGCYFFNLVVELYCESAMGDFLLKTPVVAVLANTQNLVTLGSADFEQFVLGYLTGFAITVGARLRSAVRSLPHCVQ